MGKETQYKRNTSSNNFEKHSYGNKTNQLQPKFLLSLGFSYRYKQGNCNLYLASRGFLIHRTLKGRYFFHIRKDQYYTDWLPLSSILLSSAILVLGYHFHGCRDLEDIDSVV